MSNVFPSLEPSTRNITYGDYPQLIHEANSGAYVRFLQGTDRVAQRLNITYEYLTEAQMKLLLDHYNSQQGSLIPFALSSSIWLGYSSPPISASDYEWRYTGPFTVGMSSPLSYSTSIELESVPI